MSDGLGFLHKGEEVLEAAEVFRIERALSGQTMNQNAMARAGFGFGGGGSAPVVVEGSTQVSNYNTNVNNIPPQPIGQFLPGTGRDHFSSSFR